MRIIFFGSTDVSLEFLKELNKIEQVLTVITQPDRPAGRGQKLHSTPVKIFAEEKNIPVLTPEYLKDKDLLARLNFLKPDLGIVVSYGKIIPEELFKLFSIGCINVHFSLLPKYRGASPIQWALINGEKITGVTTFLIEKGLDTGRIFVQKKIEISDNDNTITLEQKLVPIGIKAMIETIELIKSSKNINDITQLQIGEHCYAPVLKKEDGKINWNEDAFKINNLVRGLLPWPCAYTYIKDKMLKIYSSELFKDINSIDNKIILESQPGTIIHIQENIGIVVKCGNGLLTVKEVQLQDRKKMSAWMFWLGSRLKIGDKFY